MTEKIHDTFSELYRGESYERSKPDRGEPLDLEGSDLENIGEADAEKVSTDETLTEVHVSTKTYGGGDIGEAFNNARAEHGTDGVLYNFEKGEFFLKTPLDWTGIASAANTVQFDLRGTTLKQTTAVAIDMVGSGYITVWGGEIVGANNGTNRVGILLGRDSSDNSAQQNKFYGTTVRSGKWDGYALYNVASEVNEYIGCEFINHRGSDSLTGGETGGVALTCDNWLNITSPHNDLIESTTTSHNDNTFYGGTIRGHNSIWIRPEDTAAVQQAAFRDLFILGESRGVVFDYRNEGAATIIKPLFDNVRISDLRPTDAFATETATKSLGIEGLVIRDSVLSPTSNFLNIGSKITLNNPRIVGNDLQSNPDSTVSAIRGGEIEHRSSGTLSLAGNHQDVTIHVPTRSNLTHSGGAGNSVYHYIEGNEWERADDSPGRFLTETNAVAKASATVKANSEYVAHEFSGTSQLVKVLWGTNTTDQGEIRMKQRTNASGNQEVVFEEISGTRANVTYVVLDMTP